MRKLIKRIISRVKLEIYSRWYGGSKQFVVQAEYMNCQILVRANEDVGVRIMAGAFENEDVSYLLSKIQKNDVFFDVGANVGLFSVVVAKKNPMVQVHSFEPISLNVSLFETSVHLNGIKTIKINQSCIGNYSGVVEFSLASDSAYSSIHDTGWKTEIEKISVPITTIDEYVIRNSVDTINVMKVDVEGAESLVLQGARNIFLNVEMRPRLVLLELYDGHFEKFNTSIENLVKTMCEFGYVGFVFENGLKTKFELRHYNKMCNVFFEINVEQ